MRFGSIPIDEAAGHILAHKLVDKDGKKLFSKGRILTDEDVKTLRNANFDSVIVAQIEYNDLHENIAAKRVADAIAGDHVKVIAPGVGRANVIAQKAGPLRLNVPVLEQLNNIDAGITIATVREHTLVNPGDLVALVKIIPFGVPAARVEDVEQIADEFKPVIDVRPLISRRVALIISGPLSTRDTLMNSFHAPVRTRIERLKSELSPPIYVPHDAQAIAEALYNTADAHDLIIVAGISAIIDQADLVPTALQEAGGTITHFGVPVDPGSLLMLGYIGHIPVIGAPGCIKSLKTNVIDWLLPRLIAGERLTRADLVKMGHGGLLDDISERPMPRNREPDRNDDE